MPPCRGEGEEDGDSGRMEAGEGCGHGWRGGAEGPGRASGDPVEPPLAGDARGLRGGGDGAGGTVRCALRGRLVLGVPRPLPRSLGAGARLGLWGARPGR